MDWLASVRASVLFEKPLVAKGQQGENAFVEDPTNEEQGDSSSDGSNPPVAPLRQVESAEFPPTHRILREVAG